MLLTLAIPATRPVALLVHILVHVPLLATAAVNMDVGDHSVQTIDHAQKNRDRDIHVEKVTVGLAPQPPSQDIHVAEVPQDPFLRRQDRGEVTQDLDPRRPDQNHVKGATLLDLDPQRQDRDLRVEEVIHRLDRHLQSRDRRGSRAPIAAL